MKNSASRSKLIESVRQWKESEVGAYFYRPESQRVVVETTAQAPWLPALSESDIDESEKKSTIRSAWMVEADVDGKFGDIAETLDLAGLAELISALGGDDRVTESLVNALGDNVGKVMILAHEGSDEGYAVAVNTQGAILVAGMELEEEFIDEGLISMTFLATNVPDDAAPVVPGPRYGLIESQNRLFETLNASVTLLNVLRESEGVDAEFVAIIEKFNTDLADILSELSIDEGTLSERELDFLGDMFDGVFAGLNEEAAFQLD